MLQRFVKRPFLLQAPRLQGWRSCAASFLALGVLNSLGHPALGTPAPNAAGDYLEQYPGGKRPGPGIVQWEIIDPSGLNCRMATAFQPAVLDGSNTPRSIYEDNRNTFIQWPIVTTFRPKQRIQAVTGNMGAQQILVLDQQGKPWLGVQSGTDRGHCFVRANQQFLRPITATGGNPNPTPRLALQPGTYFAQGSMFSRSWREVVARGNRLCLKQVNGPPTPYGGRLQITVSNLAVRDGKVLSGASPDPIAVGASRTNFTDGVRALWELTTNAPTIKVSAAERQAMERCLASSGTFSQKLEGARIEGQPMP